VLSIVVIDVDGLKMVNDDQGHEAGDALLRQLATSCIAELRGGDGFYRIGGDEFVAVLLHADALAAEAFVSRVRPSAPAFSAGIATAPLDATDVPNLLDVADQRLIQHRGPGRGRRKRTPASPSAKQAAAIADDNIVVAVVTTTIDSESTSIEVVLRQAGTERRGKASGSAIASAEPRVAALATLEALQRLGYDVATTHLETAELQQLGSRDVVTVVVSSSAGEVEVIGSGSAIVRRGVGEAAARAVVQAIVPSLPARQVIQV
jgi:diguanylate cyclase (GGDEF)-like protein